MSADLLLPILFIIVMYIIIGCIEDGFTLISIAVLFIPVVLTFPKVVNSGSYTTFLGASIVGTGIDLTLMGTVMITVPIFAIARVLYVRKNIKDAKESAPERVIE